MAGKKSYAFIIPAYNEESMLPGTLKTLSEAMSVVSAYQGRVIVVDNNSSDNTAEVARLHGAEVVFEEINQISRARNCGANSCPEVDYLFFLDADTTVTAGLLLASLETLDGGKYCGGGSVIRFDDPEGQFTTYLWSFFSRLTGLAAGAYTFCLNRAFKESGGYSENVYAGEDVFFSRQLKKWGRRNGFKCRIHHQYPIITSNRKLKWYSKWHILRMVLLIFIMPWKVRSKKSMSFWYNRPDNFTESNE